MSLAEKICMGRSEGRDILWVRLANGQSAYLEQVEVIESPAEVVLMSGDGLMINYRSVVLMKWLATRDDFPAL